MARKPERKSAARPAPGAPADRTDRGVRGSDPVVAAFMALLAEKPIEQIGFAEIAERAGISLDELRARYDSTLTMMIPAAPRPWLRSTARSRAGSAGPDSSTTCAPFPRASAARARAAGAAATRTRKRSRRERHTGTITVARSPPSGESASVMSP